MKINRMLLYLILPCLLILTGVLLLVNLNNLKGDKSADEAASQRLLQSRIEGYTQKTFRLLEQIKFQNAKGQLGVSISYVPEVGSEFMKEHIYKELAEYAVDVNKFFPEIKSFHYSVLWDSEQKKEIMALTIDEQGVTELKSNYYGVLMDQRGGHNSSFSVVFSTIEESDGAKKLIVK